MIFSDMQRPIRTRHSRFGAFGIAATAIDAIRSGMVPSAVDGNGATFFTTAAPVVLDPFARPAPPTSTTLPWYTPSTIAPGATADAQQTQRVALTAQQVADLAVVDTALASFSDANRALAFNAIRAFYSAVLATLTLPPPVVAVAPPPAPGGASSPPVFVPPPPPAPTAPSVIPKTSADAIRLGWSLPVQNSIYTVLPDGTAGFVVSAIAPNGYVATVVKSSAADEAAAMIASGNAPANVEAALAAGWTQQGNWNQSGATVYYAPTSMVLFLPWAPWPAYVQDAVAIGWKIDHDIGGGTAMLVRFNANLNQFGPSIVLPYKGLPTTVEAALIAGWTLSANTQGDSLGIQGSTGKWPVVSPDGSIKIVRPYSYGLFPPSMVPALIAGWALEASGSGAAWMVSKDGRIHLLLKDDRPVPTTVEDALKQGWTIAWAVGGCTRAVGADRLNVSLDGKLAYVYPPDCGSPKTLPFATPLVDPSSGPGGVAPVPAVTPGRFLSWPAVAAAAGAGFLAGGPVGSVIGAGITALLTARSAAKAAAPAAVSGYGYGRYYGRGARGS